jgi:hypothetical protein
LTGSQYTPLRTSCDVASSCEGRGTPQRNTTAGSPQATTFGESGTVCTTRGASCPSWTGNALSTWAHGPSAEAFAGGADAAIGGGGPDNVDLGSPLPTPRASAKATITTTGTAIAVAIPALRRRVGSIAKAPL